MKKKAFLAGALIALMAVGAFAQTYNAESDFQVTKTATAVTITGYVGTGVSEVNIPPTIQNLPVTAIGANVFTPVTMGRVNSLTIPSSVTSIRAAAFYNLANLRSVTFLGTIPLSGFQLNAFPSNDLRAAFYATDRNNGTPGTYTKSGTTWTLTPVASATTSTAETPATSFEWFRTADGRGIIIDQYTGTAEAVRIPDRISNLPVVEIGTSAFEVSPGSGGTFITSVIIPNTVTKIGDRAFFATLITSITLPTSLTTIGSSAFNQSQLTSVTLPASITTIGGSAFSCPHLTSVTIPASVTRITFTNNSAFRGAISLNAASKTALQRVGYTGTF